MDVPFLVTLQRTKPLILRKTHFVAACVSIACLKMAFQGRSVMGEVNVTLDETARRLDYQFVTTT